MGFTRLDHLRCLFLGQFSQMFNEIIVTAQLFKKD